MTFMENEMLIKYLSEIILCFYLLLIQVITSFIIYFLVKWYVFSVHECI